MVIHMATDINKYIASKGSGEVQETEAAIMEPSKTFAEKMREKRAAANAVAEKEYTEIWRNEDRYKKVLSIMERFSRNNGSKGAGAVNAVLIHSSRPEAKYFLNFNDWASRGCFIKKGSTHTALFVQTVSSKDESKRYTNVENLFDLSQVSIPKNFTLEISGGPVELELLLVAISSSEEYGIEYDDSLPDGYDSLYIPQTKTILLREGPGPEEQAFSLLTELSHWQLAQNSGYNRTPSNEFIASSSAYILACRYGLPTEQVSISAKSFPEEVKTPGEIKEHLSAVYSMACSISKEIDRALEPLLLARGGAEHEMEAEL